MSRNWRHNAVGLENEKPRQAQSTIVFAHVPKQIHFMGLRKIDVQNSAKFGAVQL